MLFTLIKNMKRYRFTIGWIIGWIIGMILQLIFAQLFTECIIIDSSWWTIQLIGLSISIIVLNRKEFKKLLIKIKFWVLDIKNEFINWFNS